MVHSGSIRKMCFLEPRHFLITSGSSVKKLQKNSYKVPGTEYFVALQTFRKKDPATGGFL